MSTVPNTVSRYYDVRFRGGPLNGQVRALLLCDHYAVIGGVYMRSHYTTWECAPGQYMSTGAVFDFHGGS
jgi:hypothetical protein